jgi:hypothetical protein
MVLLYCSNETKSDKRMDKTETCSANVIQMARSTCDLKHRHSGIIASIKATVNEERFSSCMRFEVLTAVKMSELIFWIVLSSRCCSYQYFSI